MGVQKGKFCKAMIVLDTPETMYGEWWAKGDKFWVIAVG